MQKNLDWNECNVNVTTKDMYCPINLEFNIKEENGEDGSLVIDLTRDNVIFLIRCLKKAYKLTK